MLRRCWGLAIVGIFVFAVMPAWGQTYNKEAVQALIEPAGGRGTGRQVPGRAVEQIRPRVLDARALGTRERMPADEPRVVVCGDDSPLRRSDIGHHTVLGGGPQDLADHVRERADGHRYEHRVGVRLDGAG